MRLAPILALVLAFAAPALTSDALAQDAPALPKEAPPAAKASPFAWAKSGDKASHEKAAREKAASAGGKVIGGTLAGQGAWPWQVALMVAGEPVSADAQFCGGSMVLDTWVLTAAHCVHMADDEGNWGDLPPQAIEVFVGSNELAPGKGDLVPVQAIYRHPDYVGWEFDHDIALIHLARAPRAAYQTITVPDQEFGDYLDQPGVTTIVTGWGLTEGGEHPEALHQTEIQMMDRELCNQTLIEARANEAIEGFGYAVNVFGLSDDDAYALWDEMVSRAPVPMSGNMLCSGSFEGGKTACSGDSGGPLVVPLEDGSFVQAGIVSWGLSAANGQGCEETAMFSAYTRISNFLPWLESVVNSQP